MIHRIFNYLIGFGFNDIKEFVLQLALLIIFIIELVRFILFSVRSSHRKIMRESDNRRDAAVTTTSMDAGQVRNEISSSQPDSHEDRDY